MTNEYHGLYSTRTNQYIHYNHGWWCTECTNQLFEIDKRTDHTSEWLAVLRQWFEIGLLCIWDALLMFGNAVITLIIGLAWIVVCFFEGVASDTRIYEQQLKERDGLERDDRDQFNRQYNQLLKERHYLVIAIDQCKSNSAKGNFVSKEKSYKGPEQDFMERAAKSSPPSPRTDEDGLQLSTYKDRLDDVEFQLSELEKKLRTNHGV
ncbi:MAG: hypothetical protein WC028_31420 [Candidatus Obscuribacterales bacterium]